MNRVGAACELVINLKTAKATLLGSVPRIGNRFGTVSRRSGNRRDKLAAELAH
jgi:hypothetical protein